MIVPPGPVILLVRFVAMLEVLVLAMGVVLPLLVIDGLSAPGMVIVVVGIVNSRMHGATGHEDRRNASRGEQK
jgi:hypothetical protein